LKKLNFSQPNLFQTHSKPD